MKKHHKKWLPFPIYVSSILIGILMLPIILIYFHYFIPFYLQTIHILLKYTLSTIIILTLSFYRVLYTGHSYHSDSLSNKQDVWNGDNPVSVEGCSWLMNNHFSSSYLNTNIQLFGHYLSHHSHLNDMLTSFHISS